MSKRQALILLGLWTIILTSGLFLGFPSAWVKILGALTGLVVAAVAYRLPAGTEPKSAGSLPYAEHKNEINRDITPPIS